MKRTSRKTTRRRKTGGTVAIANPAAFEICDGGECADPQVSSDKKTIFCKQGGGCAKGGCYCQLFRKRKDVAKDDPWEVAPLDQHKEAKNEPDKFDYKCICVLPILEAEHTEAGETYTTRFQLCGTGTCSLSRTKVIGGSSGPDQMKCSGDCEGGCKCTLFSLQVKGADAKTAKWKLVAKSGKSVDHVGGVYYRCFCLK
jgi:hypothetical protein